MTSPTESTPDRIGPYRVCRGLGSEDGSRQYLALEEKAAAGAREVIVHVPPPEQDRASSELRVRRAEAFLALEHPNVARLERILKVDCGAGGQGDEQGNNLPAEQGTELSAGASLGAERDGDRDGERSDLDRGRGTGVWIAVTEHVPGVSMSELAAAGIELERDALLYVGAAVLKALAYAHGRRDDASGAPLAHGGVRPSLIRLGFDGCVRLTGFGLSALFPPTPVPKSPKTDLEEAVQLVLTGLSRGSRHGTGHLGAQGHSSGPGDKVSEELLGCLREAGAVGTDGATLAAIIEQSADLDKGRRLVREAVRAVISSRGTTPTGRLRTLVGLSPYDAEEAQGSTLQSHSASPARSEVAEATSRVESAPIASRPMAAASRPSFPSADEPSLAVEGSIEGAADDVIWRRRRQIVRKVLLGGVGAVVLMVFLGWMVRAACEHEKRTAASVMGNGGATALVPNAVPTAAEAEVAADARKANSTASPLASAPVAALDGLQLPPRTGLLTVHSSATAAYVYVGIKKMGRVETPLVVPCGKKFVALGTPTRKERQPVWLAPGRMFDIECGGATELTMQPRALK